MIWYDLHNKVIMKTNYIWSKNILCGRKREKKKIEKIKEEKEEKKKNNNKEKQYTAVWIVIMICIW